MKLEFCAVCGTTESLHQHHIEPVVVTNIKRKKKKGYNENKPLKECDSIEVFAWLFDQGVITDDGTITVCDYHHNILHGIVKFQKAQHDSLIKLGIKKARENGATWGRPTKLNLDLFNKVKAMREQSIGIKTIAKKLGIGVGTVYRVINGEYVPPKIAVVAEPSFLDLYD